MTTQTAQFPESVGGRRYTSDANPTTGLDGGYHRDNLIPMFEDGILLHAEMIGRADDVEALALSMIGSADTAATCSSSLTLANSGTITFELNEADKSFNRGQTVAFSRQSDATAQMILVLTEFDSPTGVGEAEIISATETGGPYTDWDVNKTASGGIPANRTIAAAGLATGGGTLAADRTITVEEASADEIVAGTATKAASARRLADAGKPQVLTDAANIAWAITRKKFKVTLGGSRAMLEPTGAVEGAFYAGTVKQDVTGGRLLTWHACFEWEFDEPPELPTAPGAECYVYLECLETTPSLRMFGRWAVGG